MTLDVSWSDLDVILMSSNPRIQNISIHRSFSWWSLGVYSIGAPSVVLMIDSWPELVIAIHTVTDVAGRLRIGKDASSNLQRGPKHWKKRSAREMYSESCCLQLLATWQPQVTYIVMTIVNASDCCTMPEPSFEDAVSCFEMYGVRCSSACKLDTLDII